MKNLILTLDQGTTGTTALLINAKGKILGSHNTPFKQIFPKLGWVEHNPDEILKSVKTSIKKVFEKTNKSPKNVLSVGITNQRETAVLWNKKTGKTLCNAIVWQCKRTTKRTQQIKDCGDEAWIKEKTGLSADPYFSSTKIEWLLKKHKNHKDLCVGTIDAFLIWKLTKGQSFFTEPSNASRTGLFNLKSLTWDSELLKYFGVHEGLLPKVVDSNSHFGVVKGFSPLLEGTPITGVLGDQQSSLFGHGAYKKGELKCTFGTGSFVLLNTGSNLEFSKSGLLSTVAWKLKDKKTTYALEGGAFNCASCLNWAKEEMRLFDDVRAVGKMAKKVEDSGGVFFAPTFSGVGAPYWKPEAKGAFLGLTRGANQNHLARSLFEGLSFQNTLIFKALQKDFKRPLKSLYVDGGVSQSDVFMEIQAQFSGQSLVRPKSIETTALGAAFMAGLGAGVFKSEKEVLGLNPVDKTFKARKTKHTVKALDIYSKIFESGVLSLV